MNADMSLIELLKQAGWTMAPLYVCSVVGMAVFVRKFIEFLTAGVMKDDVLSSVEPLLKDGDLSLIETHCAKDGTPLGTTMAFAARALVDTPARVEEEVVRVSTGVLARFEAHLNVLSFVAQVAPLFGLLGTVIGMVELFSGMEAAGQSVDQSTLSSGIWKALLTTAAGLLIAIPTMGGHSWLTSRVDVLRRNIEDGTGRIINRALGQGKAGGK
jgi:biopolymer transport protein ExbB